MATQGSFKHTSKYAATATKYGTREGEEGDPSSTKEPGVWDGFKADVRAPRTRKNSRLGDREKLLDKDYMAEMRRRREQSNSIVTQVRARQLRGTASEPSIASDAKQTRLAPVPFFASTRRREISRLEDASLTASALMNPRRTPSNTKNPGGRVVRRSRVRVAGGGGVPHVGRRPAAAAPLELLHALRRA